MTSTKTTAIIRTARPEEADQVTGTLTAAFVGDPIVRWVFPDAHQYLTWFPAVAKAFGGRALEHGTAHYVDGYLGAAFWLPPGVGPDEEAMGGLLLQTVPEKNQEAVLGLLEQMGSHHPHEPHWYLPLLGVDPKWQRNGLGSALLAHALARIDREGIVAYLESSNVLNIPLYQRHGFEIIGEIQSGTSPTIWPMVRKPQASQPE